jgi:hypothetical protein
MKQYRPFKTFVFACSVVLLAIFAGFSLLMLRSDDPVRDELRKIANSCEAPGADPNVLRRRLDAIVDVHGVDYIISDESRGSAFVQAGLGVQSLIRDTMNSDRLYTDIQQ